MTNPIVTTLDPSGTPPRRRLADWLGLNHATIAVLVIIGCLGLSEEIWSNFLSLYLKAETGAVLKAAQYIGVIAFGQNLLEGFGYIIGGTVAGCSARTAAPPRP